MEITAQKCNCIVETLNVVQKNDEIRFVLVVVIVLDSTGGFENKIDNENEEEGRAGSLSHAP